MSRVFAPALIWQKWIYEKMDKKKLAEFISRWGEDLNDHMREAFIRFSDTSIRNIARVCFQMLEAHFRNTLQVRTEKETPTSSSAC